ncbi:MAG: hypothetical protein K2X80_09860, partial [Pseudomonadaceae bacterium]|nr:hypothetical protein [Pseudomonadaceae bacterium]
GSPSHCIFFRREKRKSKEGMQKTILKNAYLLAGRGPLWFVVLNIAAMAAPTTARQSYNT